MRQKVLHFFARHGAAFLTGFGAGLLFLLALSFAVHSTSETEFCGSCHEMKAHLRELEGSTHWINRSGSRTGCAECHISPGLGGIVKAKINGLSEVFIHFTGRPEGARWESRRSELRARTIEELPQKNCTGCHRLDDAKPSSREAEVAHATITQHTRCLDCHSVEGLQFLVHNEEK